MITLFWTTPDVALLNRTLNQRERYFVRKTMNRYATLLVMTCCWTLLLVQPATAQNIGGILNEETTERAIENAFLKNPDASPNGLDIMGWWLRHADMATSVGDIQQRLAQEAATLDPSASKAFLDMVASVATPQTLLVGTIRDGLSKLTGKIYICSMGDAYEDTKYYILKQPTNVLRMRAAEQVIAVFKDSAGFTGTNDFIFAEFLWSLQETLSVSGQEQESLRTMHNVFGFMDTLSFVIFVVGATKLGKLIAGGAGWRLSR
jgi:hypothetical protein